MTPKRTINILLTAFAIVIAIISGIVAYVFYEHPQPKSSVKTENQELSPFQIFSVTGPIGVLVVGIITYLFFRKQHQANGLLEAFKILGTDEHRYARGKVYRLSEAFSKTNEQGIFFVPEVEKVRADFDLIASLIRAGSINKNNFLKQYGPNAWLCWQRLKDHICYERELRKFQFYMKDFEWLSEEAFRYWQWQGIDLAKVQVYNMDKIKRGMDYYL